MNFKDQQKYGYHLSQKLHIRQIYGGNKFRYFDRCPDNFQIPLDSILGQESIKKGHVAVGFSPDGKYLLSYQCKVQCHMDFGPVSYTYTLHFWLFDLRNPLKKVRKVKLFADETIHRPLHIQFCQPSDCNYMVAHGCTYSVDVSSNGKISYVSIIPSPDAATLNYCMHLRYELLPPHPPFVTSVCLKLPNVVLLNSGDMLFAILLNDKKLFQSRNVEYETKSNNQMCYCSKSNTNKQSQCSSHDLTEEIVPLTDQDKVKNVVDTSVNIPNTLDECDDINFENTDSHEHIPLSPFSEQGSNTNTEYVSFVMQGYSIPNELQSQESLPSSPFDCTATVMPAKISSVCNQEILKQTYEHRCFRSSNKGNKQGCDFFFCQAQFDAENFVNEEIQLCKDINKRFVSMRDYDMQVVDTCQVTNEVIILINALVILRDKVHRSDNKCETKSTHNREKYYKLVLYTLGYIASWNIYTGEVKVLKRFPLIEGPGTLCKTRKFSPSLSQAVQLRKSWFVPIAKSASVHTLSNHTVFTGKSLQYFFNPVLPIAVVRGGQTAVGS